MYNVSESIGIIITIIYYVQSINSLYKTVILKKKKTIAHSITLYKINP